MRSISFSLLAYNIMLGLFHYFVTVHIPYSSHDIAWLDVRLTGINAMTSRVDISPSPKDDIPVLAAPSPTSPSRTGTSTGPLQQLVLVDRSESPTFSPETPSLSRVRLTTPSSDGNSNSAAPRYAFVNGTESPTPSSSQPAVTIVDHNTQVHFHHSHTTTPAHAFVSALALGPQGFRAIWVERSKGSLEKRVVVCDLPRLHPPPSGDHDTILTDQDGVRLLEGKVVYSTVSYDLRGKLFSYQSADNK